MHDVAEYACVIRVKYAIVIHYTKRLRLMLFLVAETVVEKSRHKINNIPITVGLYYECLGIMPPSHDRSTPRGSMPDAVTIDDVDEALLDFVATTSNRQQLDDRLTQLYGRAEWAGRAAGTLTVTCCVPRSQTTAQLKDTWPQNVTRAVREVFGSFEQHSLNVLQDCWGDFLKRVGRVQQATDDIRVMLDADNCSVHVVGKTAPFRDLVNSMGKVCITVFLGTFKKNVSVYSWNVCDVIVYIIQPLIKPFRV